MMKRLASQFKLYLVAVCVLFAVSPSRAEPQQQSRGVFAMADLHMREDWEWRRFHEQLKGIKERGYQGVSVDVWWGLVQPHSPHSFQWDYYHRVFQEVRSAGLKIIPIMSTHACGGNVGDTINIPLPQWLFEKHDSSHLIYVSEAGNISKEYPSVWSTKRVIEDYRNFWKGFEREFRGYGDMIAEIPISMGPSGEIQYPFHHQHDYSTGLREAGYPDRGILQSFSESAVQSFRHWVFSVEHPGKDIEFLKKHWGFETLTMEQVSPALIFSELRGDQRFVYRDVQDGRARVEAVNQFFSAAGHFTALGRDVLKWNQWSLFQHMENMLKGAIDTFHHHESSFQRVPVSFKIPGVHWAAGDQRLPELVSGLVSTWQQPAEIFSVSRIYHEGFPQSDLGYRPLFEAIKRIKQDHPSSQINGIYTAAEMPNGYNSWANLQARRIFTLAREYNISMSGENAIGGNLNSSESVNRLFDFYYDRSVDRVVLLRMNEALASDAVTQAIAANPREKMLLKAD